MGKYAVDLISKKMEQNRKRYVTILLNTLGANDKNSNTFDYVVRQEDIGDINNTNYSITPSNGLVNGEGYLERSKSILKNDNYIDRIRLDLETYRVIYGISDDNHERIVMICEWTIKEYESKAIVRNVK